MTPRQTDRIRADFGPSVSKALDLNEADVEELAAHPLIGKVRATHLLSLRDSGPIETPADLVHAGVVGARLLPSLDQYTFGRTPLRPLLTEVALAGATEAYVDEDLTLVFSWVPGAAARPEILSVRVRFPSGRRATIHVRLSEGDVAAGRLEVPGVASTESGELYLLATLRDSRGRVSQLSTIIDVFTRNPVQIFVTPATRPSRARLVPPSTTSRTRGGIATRPSVGSTVRTDKSTWVDGSRCGRLTRASAKWRPFRST
ncbi:MAG TPA: hypothetical protein VK908_12715 [Jiangellales bacterium]|nr:hypothetical protein [Jiangellales bacterium]